MKRMPRWAGIPLLCMAAGICAALLWCALRPLPPSIPSAGTADFHFVDVGQGDCTVIVTHDGAVLIDAGPHVNELALAVYLRSIGVDRLTYAVFTHLHDDHIGGADAILRALPTDAVILPAVSEADAAMPIYKQVCDSIDPDTRVISVTDETVLTAGDLTLTLMCDSIECTETDGQSGNEVSLIIRAAVGETAVLIMGDAEADTEERLIRRYGGDDCLSAAVLRVGHHGSDTSTTPALLEAVRPTHAVISVSAENSYGHPTARVLARLSSYGIEIHRTDTDGTVILHTDGQDFSVITP